MKKSELIPGKTYVSSRTGNEYFFVGFGDHGEAWFTRPEASQAEILSGSIEVLTEKRIPKEFWRVGLVDFSCKGNAEEYCYNSQFDTKHIIHYKEVIE